LKIQAFEPEQLDERFSERTPTPDDGEVREVRGGLELDAHGVVVAYHVYARNPNDYTFRQSLVSRRIPADRVLHYYRKERVRQKRGVTPSPPSSRTCAT
jgi:capsid protein